MQRGEARYCIIWRLEKYDDDCGPSNFSAAISNGFRLLFDLLFFKSGIIYKWVQGDLERERGQLKIKDTRVREHAPDFYELFIHADDSACTMKPIALNSGENFITADCLVAV